MERITRSSKVMEVLPLTTPNKRGRKKKSEIMNGDLKAATATTALPQTQNIRRSLRVKSSTDGQCDNESKELSIDISGSVEDSLTDTQESDSIQDAPDNVQCESETSSQQTEETLDKDLLEIQNNMTRCDLIDDKQQFPIVVLHDLKKIHDFPSSGSQAVSPLAEDIEMKDVTEELSEINVKTETKPLMNDIIKEEVNTLPESSQVSTEHDIKHEEKDVEIKIETKHEQPLIPAEDEDFSYLRRSRRLKSVFQENYTLPTEIQTISQPMEIVKPEISIVKQEEPEVIEMDVKAVKEVEEMESIDIKNDARLKQFVTIKDNIYFKASDKIICKINKTMKCDCTLTEVDLKNGELGCTFNCINRLLYIECSPKCRCGEFCDNQQFQRYNYSPISVFKTEKKGFGIRADADIPPETFIIEYVGEVLNTKQFEKKASKYSKDKNRHYYFMALRSNAIIDATVKGNISRFINHSCDPNAITQKWTINGELRVGFFSVRFIKKGEEITFDYQFQRYGKKAQKCFCESSNCRGWIGKNPESGDEDVAEIDSTTNKKVKSKKVPTAKAKPKSKLIESDDVKQADLEDKNVELMRRPDSIAKSKNFYEDLEIEEQIKDLTKSGLKNRAHTIALARLVVRAKSVESRNSLLKLLIDGEFPCRRLFLDYNGLRLLHNWMCDVSVKNSIPDLYLCIELLHALSLLPITNKTVLRDSKVLERVEKWKNLDIEKKKLTKEEKKQAKAIKKKNKTQLTPQEQTLSESKEETVSTFTMTFDVLEELPTMKLIVKEKAANLLDKWEILKEDFRIPKKQKQENRKEHEKEAGMEEDLWNNNNHQLVPSSATNDRGKNRFGNDSGYNRMGYSHGTPASSNRRFLDPMERQIRRQQFEKKMEQIDIEKRMLIDHENNCAIFGLPPDTPPTSIPVKINRVTGEYFEIFGKKVPPPPNHSEFKYEKLFLTTNPDHYHLPPIDLPEHWRFAIDKYGRIYYYHEKIRISQWEAPIKFLPLSANDDDDMDEHGMSDDNLGSPDEDESSTESEDTEEEELKELLELLKRKKRKPKGQIGFERIPADINAVEEDLEKRIKLNSSITNSLDNPMKISPIEECVVKRKKRRGLITMMKFIRPRTEEDKLYGRNESRRYKEVKERLRRRKKKRLQKGEGSTDDDEDDDDELADGAGFSSKMVDELDMILTKSKQEKMRKIKAVDVIQSTDPSRMKKLIPRAMPPSDQSLIKRQFRDDIREEIAKYLSPYRSDTCTNGRITCEEDYNSLVNKLTFSVLTKESKHCAVSNSMLKATDSVKGKTKEFIKKYMSKFEGPYQRKADEQDYSLILNKY